MIKNTTRLIGFGYIAIVILTAIASVVFGSVGYAPVPISIGPEPEPIVVTIWYSTEKKAWLEEAVTRFEATNPREGRRPIRIQLVGMGSREIAQRVSAQNWQGAGQPTVVIPASSLWLEVLRSEWASRGVSNASVAGSPASLALTPLVIVAWEQRAQFLWPQGSQADFWNRLHDGLIDNQGWVSVVQKANGSADQIEQAQRWGTVKLGHTSPLTSNSGTQMLLLMAYGYHQKSSGLSVADVQNLSFATWLVESERAVPKFGDSTGTFMQELIQFGPSQYDLVATYENLAIESIAPAEQRQGQRLRIYYPPATIFSDHPYALLNVPGVSAEQRSAALQFQNFLLSRPQQELALQYGFRPADPGVPINTSDPNNPFVRYQDRGLQVDVAQQVQNPSGEVVNALLSLWQQQINR
jgi:hypothetical protein